MASFKTLAKSVTPTAVKPLFRSIYLHLRGWHHAGQDVYCPCCQQHFQHFLTGGYQQRPNALCPRCNTLERHRLLWLFIQNETNLFSLKGTFLHIAPEPIFQKRFKQLPNLHYISADLVSHWADVQMDITNIQYGDNTFDAILCSHVLEHVPDDNAAINEIYRVLVSGGWAILQVPLDPQRHQTYEDDTIIDPNERRRIFGHHDHVRIYGRDYKLRLEKAGFTVNVIPYAQRLPADKVEFYGIGADEDIYFCQKEV